MKVVFTTLTNLSIKDNKGRTLFEQAFKEFNVEINDNVTTIEEIIPKKFFLKIKTMWKTALDNSNKTPILTPKAKAKNSTLNIENISRNNNSVKLSIKDNPGRTLTKEQREYFKEAKSLFEQAFKEYVIYVKETSGDIKLSIKKDNIGEYVNVDARQDVFDGIEEKDYNKIAKMYITDYLIGEYQLKNNKNAIIDSKGRNKYTNPGKKQNYFSEKMKLTPELKNVLKIADKISSKGKYKTDAAYDNYEYYKFRFKIDGIMFNGILNIGIDKTGNKYFYEINNIKKVEGISSVSTNSPSTNDLTIPQTSEIVNLPNNTKLSIKMDNQGRVLYNGIGNYTTFDNTKMSNMSKWGKAIYLTKYKNVAQMYGENVKEVYANITNPLRDDEKTITFNQIIQKYGNDFGEGLANDSSNFYLFDKNEDNEYTILEKVPIKGNEQYIDDLERIINEKEETITEFVDRILEEIGQEKNNRTGNYKSNNGELENSSFNLLNNIKILLKKDTIGVLNKNNQSVYDQLKYSINKYSKEITLIKDQREYFKKAKTLFEKAFKEFNVELNEKTNDSLKNNIKLALSSNALKDVTEIVKLTKDESVNSNIQFVKLKENTIKTLVEYGVKDLPMMERIGHIRENILTEEQAKRLGYSTKNKHYHGLGVKTYLEIIDSMDNATNIYQYKNNKNHFIVETPIKINGINSIVPVEINQEGKYNNIKVDINKIRTTFVPKENYINNLIKKGIIKEMVIGENYRKASLDESNISQNNNNVKLSIKDNQEEISNSNAKYMWHSSSKNNIDLIKQYGFRYDKESAYFATNFDTSKGYGEDMIMLAQSDFKLKDVTEELANNDNRKLARDNAIKEGYDGIKYVEDNELKKMTIYQSKIYLIH